MCVCVCVAGSVRCYRSVIDSAAEINHDWSVTRFFAKIFVLICRRKSALKYVALEANKKMRNLQRVDHKPLTYLSHLWTKVYQILGEWRSRFVVSNVVFVCL